MCVWKPLRSLSTKPTNERTTKAEQARQDKKSKTQQRKRWNEEEEEEQREKKIKICKTGTSRYFIFISFIVLFYLYLSNYVLAASAALYLLSCLRFAFFCWRVLWSHASVCTWVSEVCVFDCVCVAMRCRLKTSGAAALNFLNKFQSEFGLRLAWYSKRIGSVVDSPDTPRDPKIK